MQLRVGGEGGLPSAAFAWLLSPKSPPEEEERVRKRPPLWGFAPDTVIDSDFPPCTSDCCLSELEFRLAVLLVLLVGLGCMSSVCICPSVLASPEPRLSKGCTAPTPRPKELIVATIDP